MSETNKILTPEEAEKQREEFYGGLQWTLEQQEEINRRRAAALNPLNQIRFYQARGDRYKRWSFIFIGCILWQTAVAFTYGMKWVHEQHVNQDLAAQVRALKGGQ